MDQGSLRRVAVLLDSLDQSTAASLLAKMPPSRGAQVRYAISQLANVDPLERKLAIADFMQKSHASTRPSAAAPVPHPSAVPVAAATIENPEPTDPLSFLNEIPIRDLVGALSDEHPQTIAIVLASMQAHVAAKLLSDLPTPICKSAIQRLARITEIPTQALQEISTHLQSLISKAIPSESQAGSKSLASILTHLSNSQREEILADLASEHPNLASVLPHVPSPTSGDQPSVPQGEPIHADQDAHPREDHADVVGALQLNLESDPQPIDFTLIEQMPADALRRVLMEVDVDTAILSLCGMDPRVVQRLLAILPRSQSREVRDRLRHVQNVGLRQIDEAQSRVYAVAMQLHDDGKLPELQRQSLPTSRLSFAA